MAGFSSIIEGCRNIYCDSPSGIQTDSFCKLHDIYLKLKGGFVTDRSSDLWLQFSNRTVHLIMRGKRMECKTKFYTQDDEEGSLLLTAIFDK